MDVYSLSDFRLCGFLSTKWPCQVSLSRESQRVQVFFKEDYANSLQSSLYLGSVILQVWSFPSSPKVCLLNTIHDLPPRSDLFMSCYLSKQCRHLSCYMHRTAGAVSNTSSVLTLILVHSKFVESTYLASPIHCLSVFITALISRLYNWNSFPSDQSPFILPVLPLVYSPYCN